MRLIRQAATVPSVLEADAPQGWLPRGAVAPLPLSPEQVLLDVRVLQDHAHIVVAWAAHEPRHWSVNSGRGERRFASLEVALADAAIRYELADEGWDIALDRSGLTADAVAAMVSGVFAAHGVETPEAEGWGRAVVPPRRVAARTASQAMDDFWLVLAPESADGYAVCYDDKSGHYGLLTVEGADDNFTHVGDYGPLWATLIGM